MPHARKLLLPGLVTLLLTCPAARAVVARTSEDETRIVYSLPLADAQLLELTVKKLPIRPILEEHRRRERRSGLRMLLPIEAYSYAFRLTDRKGRVKVLYAFEHLDYDLKLANAWNEDFRVLDSRVEKDGAYVILYKGGGRGHAIVGTADGLRIPSKKRPTAHHLVGDSEANGLVVDGSIEGSRADGTLTITLRSNGVGAVRGRYRLEEAEGKAAWKKLPAEGKDGETEDKKGEVKEGAAKDGEGIRG